MGSGVFGVALSGLNAAQSGLLTTSHNVANASTPGYNRQEIRQEASKPQFTGGGFIGRGVEVTNIVRAYDDFLEKSVLSSETQKGYLDGILQQINILDGIVADPTVGLSPAVQDFFKGVQNTTSNPASVPSRQQWISLANAMASRYQQINDRLQEVRQGVNGEISTVVSQINAYAANLADLNNQISAVTGSGKPPNDLLDQRDAVIEDLNKLIKVTATPQDDGSINVVVGNGQSLVLGGTYNKFTATPGLIDPENLEVGITQGLIDVPVPSSLLTGGKLSGLLNFRTSSLDLAQNSLGRVAIAMARTFNEQHQLGIDLNGQPGMDMFNVASPKVVSYANNGGTAWLSASIASPAELTTSDYRVFATAAGYNITRLSDNYTRSITSAQMGAGYTADGVTFQLSSGAPVVGDSFLVQPTRNGARDFEMLITDTAKLAVAAPMRTEDIASRPTDPIQLVFDTPPSTFHVVNTKNQGILAVNVPYTTGGNIDYNGWRVQVSGAPAAGDSFIVSSQTAIAAASNTGGATVTTPVTSTVNNNLGNTGTGRISAGSVNSPYDKVTLTYNAAGSTFDVIDSTSGAPLATGLAYTAGGNIDFNGWRIQISGAPANGDTFVVDRTVASLGPRNTGSGAISETVPVPPNTQFQPDLSKVQRPVTFLFTSASTFKVYEQTAAGMTELTPAALGLDPASPLTTYGANGFNYDSVNGTAFAANGWSVKLSGNIATGDRFLVGPNTAGSSDNRNALAMGNLQVTNILSDGTASYQSSYSQMVSMVGNQGNQAKIASEAQNTLVKEARSSKSGFSGVNLDEEAANLIKYQQAYQAASKVIAIAQQTFQSILDIG